ncbi:UNVERIFIED_CONTAM: hypothetical protein RMT77_012730 [Armadillidium vulgare]
MDIKSEIEIKMEEFVPENDFSQDYQSFPQIESMIPLAESIKKELDENSSFIKSEERESDLEFVFNEEKIKNDVIKSENSPMKKFDVHHVRKFMSVKNVSWLLNKVNEKGLKAHFESDEEEYFAQILTSKFPLLLLKKFSLKELMMMKADDDDLNDNRSIPEKIDETELLFQNNHDVEEDESSFEDEEEFEGFIHSDNFKERSNLLKQMILQLRNLQSFRRSSKPTSKSTGLAISEEKSG